LRFLGGRMFAAARARTWSTARRLFYAAACPLIPVVRLRRAVHDLRRSGQLWHLLPQVLPMLVVGLVCDAAGEMAGYLFGGGQAMRTLTEMEFHRHRFMKRRDQIAMDHHLRETMQLPISGAGS
jgi:hypothetical protein